MLSIRDIWLRTRRGSQTRALAAYERVLLNRWAVFRVDSHRHGAARLLSAVASAQNARSGTPTELTKAGPAQVDGSRNVVAKASSSHNVRPEPRGQGASTAGRKRGWLVLLMGEQNQRDCREATFPVPGEICPKV